MTKGPWILNYCESGAFEISADAFVIAARAAVHHRADESCANARLITAAPTMYQELELAADTFRDFSNVLRVIGKDTMSAAAAIAERHIREQLATIMEQPC